MGEIGNGVEIEVTPEIQDTMGQLLMDVDEVDEDIGSNVSGTDSLSNTVTDPDPTVTPNGEPEVEIKPDIETLKVDPTPVKNKEEPVVIDLSDDDEDYSKENIEKAPAKSINNLVKSLTAEESTEALSKIKIAVGKLPRDQLEELFCAKLQENATLEMNLSKLEGKLTSFMLYRDRLTFKAQFLQGQFADSARAMLTVTDQLTRNPKNGLKAFNPPTPLKFQRTVGIQCRNDPLPRLKGPLVPNSKVLNTSHGNPAGFPPRSRYGPANVGYTAVPLQIGMKRSKPQAPIISVDEIRSQVSMPAPGPLPPKRRIGPASAMRAQAQMTANNSVTSDTINLPKTTPAMVDLSGLNQPKAVTGIPPTVTTSPGVLVTQNGSTYQIITTGTPPQRRTIAVQQQPRNSPQQLIYQQGVPRAPPPLVNQKQRAVVATIADPSRPLMTLAGRRVGPAQGPRFNSNVAVVVKPQSLANGMIQKFVLPPVPMMAIQPKKPKEAPPRPTLTLQEQGGGIVLSWTHDTSTIYAEIQSYQIYACQEPLASVPCTPVWRRVGDVKALPLPMACTLSQFTSDNRYYFIVRGVDVYNRTGEFCEIVNIILTGTGSR